MLLENKGRLCHMVGSYVIFIQTTVFAPALSLSITDRPSRAIAPPRMAYYLGDYGMATGTVKWFNTTKGFGSFCNEWPVFSCSGLIKQLVLRH